MASVTLNQNIAECLRSTSHIGGTTVRNICSGVDTYVPWGSMDWVVVGGASVLIATFAAMLASLAIMMWRDF